MQADVPTLEVGLPALDSEYFSDQLWGRLHPELGSDSSINWRQTDILCPVPDQLHYVQLLHLGGGVLAAEFTGQVQDQDHAAAGGESFDSGSGATALYQKLSECGC